MIWLQGGTLKCACCSADACTRVLSLRLSSNIRHLAKLDNAEFAEQFAARLGIDDALRQIDRKGDVGQLRKRSIIKLTLLHKNDIVYSNGLNLCCNYYQLYERVIDLNFGGSNMVNLNKYLYEQTKSIIVSWDEQDVYAISFFVYSNETNTYKNYNNVSEFSISYNTENDCKNAPKYSEYRWNYAFWRQNTISIINPNEANNEGINVLFRWYHENGVKDIGLENHDSIYDENHQYIGKGPIGYYELLTVVSNVAKQLQTEGVISKKFGGIPIIVHDLEYCWYVKEATLFANPNGEADVFLEALKRGFE